MPAPEPDRQTEDRSPVQVDPQDPIRQLASLGIDIHQLGGQDLPREAWEIIVGVVRHIRGKNRRWYAAASMTGRFQKVLSSGGTVDALAAQFAAGKSLAPLMAHTELREAVLAADLPGPLNHWLASVVRRTKLRRTEKVDVVADLLGQFRNCLAAGQSATDILDDLGDPRPVARRLRREAIRRRPWWWHVWRWSFRAAVFSCIVISGTIGWLLYRFHSVKRVPTGDTIERLDAIAAAIPPGDRAWPDYVEGLSKLDIPSRQDTRFWQNWSGIHDACSAGPTHPAWNEAVTYLNANQASVDDFLRGAARPSLGFIRRDPLNERWLGKLMQGTVAMSFRKPEQTNSLLLPESNALRQIHGILAGSAQLASQSGDWPRAVSCLTAMVNIARQVFDEEDFAVMRMIAFYDYDGAVTTLASILAAQREAIGEAELRESVTALSAWSPDWQVRMLNSERTQCRELFSELYSADGRFTGEGLALLYSFPPESPHLKWLTEFLMQTGPIAAASRTTGLNLVGPLIVPLVADRDELLRVADQLDDLFAADVADVATLKTETLAHGRYDQEIDRLAETRWSQIRYLPVIAGQRSAWIRSSLESRRNKWALRDAILIVAAAELYRRQHGAWPESTAALTPEFVQVLPLDPYDGQPLRLVILHDQPVVYSAGLDCRDNTAESAVPRRVEIDDRDWQLFPPLKADPPSAR
jgi:hypothetical protein